MACISPLPLYVDLQWLIIDLGMILFVTVGLATKQQALGPAYLHMSPSIEDYCKCKSVSVLSVLTDCVLGMCPF